MRITTNVKSWKLFAQLFSICKDNKKDANHNIFPLIIFVSLLFSICKDNKKDANHNKSAAVIDETMVVFDMQR